jgi:geranylgeranyl reductase family protein
MKRDVAIVGAGPAGSHAAYRLARTGARVVLIDPSHPREKPCGGGITARALALVADMMTAGTLPSCVIRSVRFIASDGRNVVTPLGPATEGDQGVACGLVVASRADFDGALLASARQAGAELLRARVTDLTRCGAEFCLETTGGAIRSGSVIGADGAGGLARRRLARPFSRAELTVATGYFAHGATSDEITIELTTDPPGYFWSFPRPSHLAVGVCAPAAAGRSAAALRAAARRWIERTGLGAGARLEPYSWPIPSLPPAAFTSLRVSGPGWFLVGDAAGLVDPITREGIYFALASGGWAAEAAADGHAASGRYADRVRDEVASELSRAARYQAGFFTPRFAALLVSALEHSAAIRSVMLDLIAGRQGYRGLKWRLIRTLEVGLACRLLLGRAA